MKNWFLMRILRWIGRRFDGHKTKIGGGGLLLMGIVHILSNVYPELNLPRAPLEQSLTEIASGFAVLGIGGKAEKLKNAVEKGGEK